MAGWMWEGYGWAGIGCIAQKKNVFQDWWAEKAKRSFKGTILSLEKKWIKNALHEAL